MSEGRDGNRADIGIALRKPVIEEAYLNKVRSKEQPQLSFLRPDLSIPPHFGLVDYKTAKGFIEPIEWLGTLGPFKYGFGVSFGNVLGAVVVYSSPTTNNLAKGICGPDYARQVLQLSRGARLDWTPPNTSSQLIGWSLRWLKTNTPYRIIIAYADPKAGEVGAVYQACNFLYVGQSDPHIDVTLGNEKLPSTTRSLPKKFKSQPGLASLGLEAVVVQRPRKFRYVHFIGSKYEKRALRKALKYSVEPYPKRG